MSYIELQILLVHEQAWNFSHLWIKAKAAFLFEYISTLFLLSPTPLGSNFESFVTKNCPAPLSGMHSVLSIMCQSTVSLLTNVFSSARSLLKVWIPWILGMLTVLLGNWWFKQPRQTQTSSHSLFWEALHHFSACQVPNHHTSSLPLRLLTRLSLLKKTLTPFTAVSGSYFQSCSEPLLISCCPLVLSFRIFMQ